MDIKPPIFDRKPYVVKYYDQKGEIQKIRRKPPAKMHNVLPTDDIKLTGKENDDFENGGIYRVHHISTRQPNTMQLINDEGETNFVSFYDVQLENRNAEFDELGNPIDHFDAEINSEYLYWP